MLAPASHVVIDGFVSAADAERAAREREIYVDVSAEFTRQWFDSGRFSVIVAGSVLGLLYRDIYAALRRLERAGMVRVDGPRWRPGPREEFAA